MSVVLIGGSKGGTGKTTMVVNLAVESINRGKKTVIIDTDRQGSATDWQALRQSKIERGDNLKSIPLFQKYGSSIRDEVQYLRQLFDHIIIDAGGYDSPELRSSLLIADKFYTPVPTGAPDIWGLSRLLDILEQARAIRPDIVAFPFINMAETNYRIKDDEEVRDAILEDKTGLLQLSKAVIHRRVSIKNSIYKGRGVSEAEKKESKAIQEMEVLYQEIFGGEK